MFRLPENVYFCEEPQIARWDYKTNNWRTDCFMDRVYNEGRRLFCLDLLKLLIT